MPKQFTKILDMLNTKAAANQFSPKTYVNLVGEFSKKAYDNGELSKKEYMEIIQPLFGDAGIMASDKIKKYKDELNKYANGGRIGFLDGGDTKYNAMVTEMYIKLGGEEGTGMDIDSFAKEYFKKFNQGGRVGYKEGLTAKQFKRQETENLVAKINEYFDIKGSGSKSGKNQIMGAPDGITANTETLNAIIKMDIPIMEKINLLGSFGYGKDRFKVEKGNEELFLGEGGYKDRNIGLSYNEGGEGFSGSVIRNLERGDNDYQVKFLKKLNEGGRVNYNEGSLDPDTLALKEKIEEIMDIEGVGFEEAFKQAMRELASQSKE
jgi:hypothetical protein